MKIKTLLAILSLFALTISQALAQRGPMGSNERIKTIKVGYLTDRLDLDESTAIKFWPIFNNFEEKRLDLQKQMVEMRPQENLSDEEAEIIIAKVFEIEESLLNVKKELSQALSVFLPPTKLLLFHQADRDFNLRMVREFRDRNRGRMEGQRKR